MERYSCKPNCVAAEGKESAACLDIQWKCVPSDFEEQQLKEKEIYTVIQDVNLIYVHGLLFNKILFRVSTIPTWNSVHLLR
jgi:hypothetical protein